MFKKMIAVTIASCMFFNCSGQSDQGQTQQEESLTGTSQPATSSVPEIESSAPTIEDSLPPRGTLVQVTSLGVLTPEEIEFALQTKEIELGIPMIYSIDRYSILYTTLDPNGKVVLVSGLISVPQKEGPLPMVSDQHPTILLKDLAPSKGASETNILASLGYFSIAPDFLGFGISSHRVHNYMHASSLADSVIDMIRAGKQFANQQDISLTDHLFLMGYSLGGFATMATHRKIEEEHSEEFSITFSSMGAGAYDLETSIQLLLQAIDHPNPIDVFMFLESYITYYQWDQTISHYVQKPFDVIAPSLIDGSLDMETANKPLPHMMSNLLDQDFVNNMMLPDQELRLKSVILENTLYQWYPKAPVALYHGVYDETVPNYNAQQADSYFSVAQQEDGLDYQYELCEIFQEAHAKCQIPFLLFTIEKIESYLN